LLKSVELQFSIRGYNIRKIDKFYAVSTKITNRLIMMNINLTNLTTMKQIYDSLDASLIKDELGDTMEEYAKILIEYEEDSVEFYKKLNLIEKFLK
jgi:sulfatase maturation enzyme AslB (radical SAM superfamily)